MSEEKMATAKQKYDEFMAGNQELSAIERLRFFCSCAMSGQDWLDVESFFDDLAAHPSAQAIETAAIMRADECVISTFNELQFKDSDTQLCVKAALGDAMVKLRALIPQDGRTALEELCLRVIKLYNDDTHVFMPKFNSIMKNELSK